MDIHQVLSGHNTRVKLFVMKQICRAWQRILLEAKII